MKTPFDRQTFLGPKSTETFSQSIIGIVGLCGGGSHIAQQLVHIGFRRFRLLDPDRVEHPNLNRMVGSSLRDAQERTPKTKVLHRQIMRIQPGAEIILFEQPWQEQHIALRECTIVFGCVDSFAQRDELEAYCRRFLVPYIDIGMDVHKTSEHHYNISGQVITSLPGGPCMRCMGFITPERIAQEAARYGDAGARPQVVWPNGVLASTAIGVAVSLLTPWRRPQEFIAFIEYDGNRHELRPSNVLSVLQGRPCPHYPLQDIGDPFWQPTEQARHLH
jgi:hypothetical protein